MSEPCRPNSPHIRAHDHCIRHEAELVRSDLLGCFYCLRTYPPSELDEWIDERDGDRTALCPRCGIDSVIGAASGYPITREFLEQMHAHWFEHRMTEDGCEPLHQD